MILALDTEISKEIPEPILVFGKNIGGSSPLFFHGTTEDVYKNIVEEGFTAEPLRPTFSASPNYSLAYCRKSESYIRGLIAKGKNEELEKEVACLIDNGAISREDLNDTHYQWWISKADNFYKNTIDITQKGILLAFAINHNIMEEPKESVLKIENIKDKKIIAGAPSYWRTRQFALKRTNKKIINLINNPQLIIHLNKSFVDSIRELDSKVKKGKLKQTDWESYTKEFNSCLKYDTKNFTVSREQLAETLVDQIIESSFIKQLRDVFIAKLKSLGLKVYWAGNKNFIEDPRWDLTKEDSGNYISCLRNNLYYKNQWSEYVTESIEQIKLLDNL